jgi:hypothetical protein
MAGQADNLVGVDSFNPHRILLLLGVEDSPLTNRYKHQKCVVSDGKKA